MTSTTTRLSFGLAVPTSSDVLARFDDLAGWMSTNAGLVLVPRALPSYKELVASVREGTSDVVWLPPVAYAWVAEGVTPVGSIARDAQATYSSAFVVREDSAAKTLADLAGLRVGWVDPWSAAGYVVPLLELAREKISRRSFGEEKFFGSHTGALEALAKGECDVVATYARSDKEGPWSKMEDLRARVIAMSGAIPPDVIAVRRNLAPSDYDVVLRAFRAACAEGAGRPLMRAVFDGDTLREGLDPGHEALRFAYERGIANGLFD